MKPKWIRINSSITVLLFLNGLLVELEYSNNEDLVTWGWELITQDNRE